MLSVARGNLYPKLVAGVNFILFRRFTALLNANKVLLFQHHFTFSSTSVTSPDPNCWFNIGILYSNSKEMNKRTFLSYFSRFLYSPSHVLIFHADQHQIVSLYGYNHIKGEVVSPFPRLTYTVYCQLPHLLEMYKKRLPSSLIYDAVGVLWSALTS